MRHTFLGSYPRGSSPISIFAGIGDFGAPVVAMRSAGMQGFESNPAGRGGDYTGYNADRKFGTTYLGTGRAQFGDAPKPVDFELTNEDGGDWQKYLQAGTAAISTILDAWGKANAAQKQQLQATVAQQTGLTPEQVKIMIEQQSAAAKKTPEWVLPVALGVGGLAVVGVLLYATRSGGRRR